MSKLSRYGPGFLLDQLRLLAMASLVKRQKPLGPTVLGHSTGTLAPGGEKPRAAFNRGGHLWYGGRALSARWRRQNWAGVLDG